MRIIGGKYRGKKLYSPESDNVRPTADRAREALFNILRSRLGGGLESLRLLDVFAGSGAFALEALSQGFGGAAMVDIDTRAAAKNAALFPAEKNNLKIIRADATKLGKAFAVYDVLFMDAPYQKGLSEPALQCLAEQGWLQPGALCLIEIEKAEELILPDAYEELEVRRYGLAKVVIAEFKA